MTAEKRDYAILAFKEWIRRDSEMEYADRLENIEIYKIALEALEAVGNTDRLENPTSSNKDSNKDKLTEWLEQCRDVTPEERDSVDKYVESISKETGFDFDEVQEELDFVQPHKSIPVKLKVADGDKKVSIGVLEQVMWERDVAIDQLKELGYELGQKIEKLADGDCISRQAVMERIENEYRQWGEEYDVQQVLGDIEDLPSATPVRPTGHWIEEDMFDGDVAYRCSKCNELFCIIEGTPQDNEYNFCPNCGARMDGDTE